MTAETHLRRPRLPAGLGPIALFLVSLVALLAVLWGALFPRQIEVVYVDAGPVDAFEIGRVDYFPEHDFYVVGLKDARLRALDGRIEATGCSVRWLPDDRRGVDHNPLGRPGVFEDPCSNAVWSAIGNAISGTNEPMRTPHIDWRRGEDDVIHAHVEVINPDADR